jgi:hypothetical protein
MKSLAEALNLQYNIEQLSWWLCLKVSNFSGNKIGIVVIQKNNDSIYLSRVDSKMDQDVVVSTYYQILNDVRQYFYQNDKLRSLFVSPLYGYGTDLYNYSLRVLNGDQNCVEINDSHLYYDVLELYNEDSLSCREFIMFDYKNE